jgi:hypothetical protein
MAPPGETACRPPMSCGMGKWGAIPVESDTVYVDGSYTGGNSDGTVTKPYVTVSAGVSNAPDGAIVAIAAGSYSGPVYVFDPVRLWGVCPAQVTIESAGNIAVLLGSDEAELHGVTARNGGVWTGNVSEVLIDGVHVVDTAFLGVVVGGDASAMVRADVTMRSVLVERASRAAVVDYSSHLDVVDCELRDTQSGPQGRAYGLGFQRGILDAQPTGTVTTTRVEGVSSAGIYTVGAEVRFESVSVVDTQPNTFDESSGYAVAIQAGGEPSVVEIDGMFLESSYTAGLYVRGSEATVTALTVLDTLPGRADDVAGSGLIVTAEGDLASVVDARWSFIDLSHEAGVAVWESDLTLTGLVLRATRARLDGKFGHGINVGGVSSSLVMTGSVIESNVAMGFQLNDGSASVAATILRGTESSEGGLFGDGVVVVATNALPSLTVSTSLIAGNARAGLSAFGAEATIENSHLECNPIALVSEALDGMRASIQDVGGNRCSCDDEERACKAESAALEPPLPLPAVPDPVSEL